MLEDEEIDRLLTVLSNPTRRKILAKLVQEKHYPLQLSKELRISQQAITKHLKMLERYGIVESVSEPSREGPPRKQYRTTKHFILTVSIDNKMFDTRARKASILDEEELGEGLEDLEEDFKKVLHTQNYKDRVRRIGRLLERTEDEIRGLESKRALLLQMKSGMLKEAYSIILDLYLDYSHRAVLYQLLEDPDMDTADIARSLNMTEGEVEEVISELVREDMLPRRRDEQGRGKKREA